jgi:hypothetical protein
VVTDEAGELGVDKRTRVGLARVGEQVVHPAPDHHVLEQRDRPAFLDDDSGLTPDRAEPLTELLRVGHRRRQRHQLHRLGQVDDHLFPGGTAERVGEVVHLVHHDVRQARERRRSGVQHVAQHLGRHDDDGSLAVDRVVTGEETDTVDAVAVDELGVLLIRQRLDRRRVEALAAGRQGQVDGELADDCLARSGGSRDEHA